MSWTSIITALVLALASAFLVFIDGWEPWQAFLAVTCAALGFILTLFAVILWWLKGEDRAAFWRSFWSGFRHELDEWKKFIGIKKH